MARRSAVPHCAPQQTMTIEQAVATAYGHWQAGQANPAEQLCQQVLQVWPEHPDVLHLLGLLAHTHGNLKLAIDYLHRACASPRAPALFSSNLAEMCRQAGRLAEGEAAARRAVEMDAGLVGAWTNLGIILQEAGKLRESLVCLERVVGLMPDNPQSHNNLANTLQRLGRFEEARGHYEKAITLAPSYAEAHNNLANLLNEAGEYDQAMAEVRQAIEINPRYADAYINAAAIALAHGQIDEGLRWLGNLASFAPDHPGGLAARARLLKETDDLPAAERAARAAVAAAPESGEAQETLGQVLQAMGRIDEALAAYDKAFALPMPLPENALVGKACLLMENGDREASSAVFEQALERNPNSVNALFNRGELKTFKRDDPEIGRMEGLLAATDGAVPNAKDRILLHFTLGKAWLDAGEADRAFLHLAEGNRLKRATFTYDADAIDRWMKSIAAAFTPELMQRLAGLGDSSEVPVFIVGMPRAGTTLVEQILASHAEVHGAGELKVLQRMVDRIGGPDGHPLGYPQLAAKLLDHDLPALGKTYAERVAALAPAKRRVVDKMPANFLYAGLIHLILPRARIIHCRRDPMDTCLSCYTKLFAGEQKFTYDLAELGRFYKGYEALMAHWRPLLPPGQFIEVDYEAVVDDVEGQARRLIDFLGLDWDEACLRFYETRRAVHTASANQVRQPIYRASVGRWKGYASYLGPLLAVLGMAADAP